MRKSLMFIIVCFFLFSTAICPAANTVDTAINFYGHVISDANEPVAGAYVFTEITPPAAAKPQKTIVQTDPNGFFKIEQPAGSLKITNIRKKGYYFPKQKPSNLTFDLTKNQQTPALFKINKRKQPTKVQSMHTYVAWASKASNYTIDLTQRGYPAASTRRQTTAAKTSKDSDKTKTILADKPKTKTQKENPKKHTDIKITTSITEDATGYTMHFETPEKNSGIIITDKLLDQAPQTGYEAKTDIKIDMQTNATETRKYLYIKAREEKIYSRITLSAKPGEKNMLVRISCLSNLNGSKIFQISTPPNERPKSKPLQRWDSEQIRRNKSQQKRQKRMEMLKGN